MSEFDHVVVTCEHGGCRVPPAYRRLFRGRTRLLHSHRGHDPGALELARRISKVFRTPLIYSDVSRLLVDLNRSLHNDEIFSTATRPLPQEMRARILRSHYHPYRGRVERRIARTIESGGRVLHLSIHTFTPVFRGRRRHTDIGLLYDPKRKLEAEFCGRWRRELSKGNPSLIVRMNDPYKGTADGLTTCLRTLPNAASRYAGVELEVNQRFPRRGGARWRELQSLILECLRDSISIRRRAES